MQLFLIVKIDYWFLPTVNFYWAVFLELYVQFDSYSLFVYSRIVAVGEAAHIVDAQHSEDVLDAHGNLDVRGRAQIVVRVILVWEFK